MEYDLTTLFQAYAEQEAPPTIELQDKNHKPIAALYLKNMEYNRLVVNETNTDEKYFIYIDGIGIYFSYFKKITPVE